MVEVWFMPRSFSIIIRFREKESVCMSRVSITCSGWERVRLECFFRRQKSAARRRRATNARAPRAMPILAPVERLVDLWEEAATGVSDAVCEGIWVTVVREVLAGTPSEAEEAASVG